MKRPNLFVRTYSAATKINFDGDRASGVNFVRVNSLPPLYNTNAEMQTAIATKEVIVAAGAIHSPKLLLLSGIGPADELKQVNIPVKKDLPGVGKNLHDHSMTWVEWFFDDVFYPSAYTISKHLDAYAWNRNGIFSWSGLGGGGFIKTKPEMDRPDVQFTCFPKDLQSEIDQDTVAVNTTRKAAMVVTITLDTPKTKGYVSLASDDYKADPILGDTLEQQFRAGTNHPDDMASLVAGINALRNIKNTPPMSTRVGAEMNPGSQVNTTADVEDWIRKNIKRTDHWVGSCKMGNDADPMAVVDERLRVRGLKGLRVVDGSIMPQINHGNTHATCIMIGEAGAKFIKEDNNT
jgi:choline dehydrogenase